MRAAKRKLKTNARRAKPGGGEKRTTATATTGTPGPLTQGLAEVFRPGRTVAMARSGAFASVISHRYIRLAAEGRTLVYFRGCIICKIGLWRGEGR